MSLQPDSLFVVVAHARTELHHNRNDVVVAIALDFAGALHTTAHRDRRTQVTFSSRRLTTAPTRYAATRVSARDVCASAGRAPSVHTDQVRAVASLVDEICEFDNRMKQKICVCTSTTTDVIAVTRLSTLRAGFDRTQIRAHPGAL